jgi:hypothetical protein
MLALIVTQFQILNNSPSISSLTLNDLEACLDILKCMFLTLLSNFIVFHNYFNAVILSLQDCPSIFQSPCRWQAVLLLPWVVERLPFWSPYFARRLNSSFYPLMGSKLCPCFWVDVEIPALAKIPCGPLRPQFACLQATLVLSHSPFLWFRFEISNMIKTTLILF